MKIPWVIVGGTGYDVEEIDNPQTRDMECPSCEKRVRFVEKELIKNLRVFGVPLVGVEKGRRVFECPRCHTCVEPPVEDPAIEAAQKQSAAAASLEAQLTRARDEQWLWEKRADLASQNGDMELAAEAMKLRQKAACEVERLTTEVERVRARAATSASVPVSAPARPAVVARAGATGVEPTGTDEFAALRARIARKQQADEAEVGTRPTDPAGEARREGNDGRASEDREFAARDPAEREADIADEFAALKQRLASRSAEREADAGREQPDALRSGPAADATAGKPAYAEDADRATAGPPVPQLTTIDDDFAALRRKLDAAPPAATERSATDNDAYEALKREIVEGTSTRETPAPPTETTAAGTAATTDESGGGGDEDDPIAALKRKLRKR